MERTLVVGLGNPGPQYVNTRHNIGFMIIDTLAELLNIQMTQQKFNGICGQGRLSTGQPLPLLKPQTFMNLSGKSVAPCAQFFKLPPSQIIVIHDELEFPYGVTRVKVGGGHAGHNGLKSIHASTGTKDFLRIRVGIGRPKRGSVSDYVLANFSTDEGIWLDQLCRQTTEDIELVIKEGARKAMNLIHARPTLIPSSH